MAEILKRKYELLVLKVNLDTSTRQVVVHMAIEMQVDGEYRRVDEHRILAEAMGLPDRLEQRKTRYRGYDFTLPNDTIEWLKQCMIDHNPERVPLWLHLTKPYGYLGMVPWERLIQEELDVAILRVPEFLAEPPRENPSVLDVVLCSSRPAAKGSFMIVEHIGRIIDKIKMTVPHRTTIHVFVDRESYHELNHINSAFDDSVRFYDPETASSYMATEATLRIEDRPGQIRSPWLLWIRDSLQRTSIDVVHFVTHGYMSSDRGALALAESPLINKDRRMARFVGAAELTTFYTQIGAWATVFSSPENNYSEMGLRQLADTIAQKRPGPVVYHEIPQDWDAVAIGDVYRFLFGSALSAPPPATPSVFIYCHPLRVITSPATIRDVTMGCILPPPLNLDDAEMFELDFGGNENLTRECSGTIDDMKMDYIPEPPLNLDDAAMFELDFSGNESLTREFSGSSLEEENVPNWISASERFIEQNNYDLRKMAQDKSASNLKEMEIVEDTLQEIQDIMITYGKKKGG